MASKKKVLVRVSVFFINEQAVPLVLDPKTDSLKELPTKLVITRGNGDVVTIHREHVCYYVVSKFEQEEGERHPAFPKEGEVEGLELI